MSFSIKIIIFFIAHQLIYTSRALSLPSVGTQLPTIELKDENGGRTNGQSWSSDMIKDHVWLFFYVDPDHKDDNATLEAELKKEAFPSHSFGTIAVINLAATWIPDALLKSLLKEKQDTFPRVTYVFDQKKALVNSWKLADDDYNVLLFDPKGAVLFAKNGVLTSHEIQDVINLIRKNISPSEGQEIRKL